MYKATRPIRLFDNTNRKAPVAVTDGPPFDNTNANRKTPVRVTDGPTLTPFDNNNTNRKTITLAEGL